MIRTDPGKFRQLVEESLRRQVAAINKVNVFIDLSGHYLPLIRKRDSHSRGEAHCWRSLFVSDPRSIVTWLIRNGTTIKKTSHNPRSLICSESTAIHKGVAAEVVTYRVKLTPVQRTCSAVTADEFLSYTQGDRQ